MKKSFLLLISIGLMASCSLIEDLKPSSGDHEKPEGLMEEWTLVEMSGNIVNVPPTTGQDMPWQETIQLFDDGTFIKTRTTDQGTQSAKGNYQYEERSDGKYLKLMYVSDHALIGNCSNSMDELYVVDSVSQIRGTWMACDGPGLKYRKEE
jgi:hypothetical protein